MTTQENKEKTAQEAKTSVKTTEALISKEVVSKKVLDALKQTTNLNYTETCSLFNKLIAENLHYKKLPKEISEKFLITKIQCLDHLYNIYTDQQEILNQLTLQKSASNLDKFLAEKKLHTPIFFKTTKNSQIPADIQHHLVYSIKKIICTLICDILTAHHTLNTIKEFSDNNKKYIEKMPRDVQTNPNYELIQHLSKLVQNHILDIVDTSDSENMLPSGTFFYPVISDRELTADSACFFECIKNLYEQAGYNQWQHDAKLPAGRVDSLKNLYAFNLSEKSNPFNIGPNLGQLNSVEDINICWRFSLQEKYQKQLITFFACAVASKELEKILDTTLYAILPLVINKMIHEYVGYLPEDDRTQVLSELLDIKASDSNSKEGSDREMTFV